MKEFQKIEDLAEHVKEYVNTQISLVKLGIAEKISKIIAWTLAGILVFFILSLFIVFISLFAAHGIGNALGRPILGFLIVAAFYLCLAMLVWWKKEKLLRIPLMNVIIGQLFSDENKDTNEKD